ncbi:hypothetical protein O1L55_39435 [Streptomyces albulus]|nr:hypothetical protein [Streptomyces noursei]
MTGNDLAARLSEAAEVAARHAARTDRAAEFPPRPWTRSAAPACSASWSRPNTADSAAPHGSW